MKSREANICLFYTKYLSVYPYNYGMGELLCVCVYVQVYANIKVLVVCELLLL